MAKVKNELRLPAVRRIEPGLPRALPGCGAWNSMVETIEERRQPADRRSRLGGSRAGRSR